MGKQTSARVYIEHTGKGFFGGRGDYALDYTGKDFYPNISVLLRIMAMILVTSCECERSVSILRLIKIPLRSTMDQERLMPCQCHSAIPTSTSVRKKYIVVEQFAQRQPQRMLLVNPLDYHY